MVFILTSNRTPKRLDIATPNDDCVKSFMIKIGKYELLKRSDELELAIDIDSDTDSSQASSLELFNSNLRLVVSVAKRYLNKGLDMEDLIQEGCIGLSKAITRYDHTRGNKFSTHAVWWIRQGITRALADKSKNIRIPVHMVSLISKYRKLIKDVEVKLGRSITDREAMLSLDIDANKLALLKRSIAPNKSLDELVAGQSNDEAIHSIGDTLTDGFLVHDNLETGEYTEYLYELIEETSSINPLCPQVLNMYYGLDSNPRTQKDICNTLSINTKTFKDLIDKGIKYIKENISNDF
jgi:RNA polymerase primary sigma factor